MARKTPKGKPRNPPTKKATKTINKKRMAVNYKTVRLREDPQLDIDFRMGDVFDDVADALVVTSNREGLINRTVHNKLHALYGTGTVKAAFLNAFSGKVRPGDVYSLNLTADGTTTPYKYLILAVEPNPGHIAKCYEALMDKLEALHIDSVTVTGLGCGAMNVSADDSAKHLSNAIQARIDTGRLAKLKNLIVCDMIEHIVKKFAQAFSNDSESTSTDDTDNADFTYDVDPSKLTDDPCPICLMELDTEGLTVVALKICHHMFHKECFTQLVNNSGPKRCPNCTLFFSFPKGDMPSNATMSCNLHRDKKVKLEGGVGYYEIVYDVPSGIQGPMHLRPGLPYRGTTRYAYLPNTEAGAKVLKLLKKAFECRLTFTIGDSITTGAQNVVVWNNIHHKTSLHGGATSYGYPDADYLDRVTEELKNAGITEEMIE